MCTGIKILVRIAVLVCERHTTSRRSTYVLHRESFLFPRAILEESGHERLIMVLSE